MLAHLQYQQKALAAARRAHGRGGGSDYSHHNHHHHRSGGGCFGSGSEHSGHRACAWHFLTCPLMHASAAAVGTAAYWSAPDRGSVEPPPVVPPKAASLVTRNPQHAAASAAAASAAACASCPDTCTAHAACIGKLSSAWKRQPCGFAKATMGVHVPCILRDSFAATLAVRCVGTRSVRATRAWLRSAGDLSQSPALATAAGIPTLASMAVALPAPLVWTAAASLFAVGALDTLVDMRAEAKLQALGYRRLPASAASSSPHTPSSPSSANASASYFQQTPLDALPAFGFLLDYLPPMTTMARAPGAIGTAPTTASATSASASATTPTPAPGAEQGSFDTATAMAFAIGGPVASIMAKSAMTAAAKTAASAWSAGTSAAASAANATSGASTAAARVAVAAA